MQKSKGVIMKAITRVKKSLVIVAIIVLIATTAGFGTMASAAASTTDSSKPFDVTQGGANGTDTKDDTAAIQSALNKYSSVTIPDGTYYVNVEQALHLKSNQMLTLSAAAVLTALPTARDNYSVLDISGVSDVTVSGGQIVGDRAVHKGSTGEWGMGILIENGATRISISNVTITNCWGDGVYLGGAAPVSNITLTGVTCDGNRRQGLSITNASFVTITDSTFKNTHGTAPEAGIDIEPNSGNSTTNISIINTQCSGNAGSGLDLMGISERISDVTVTGSSFTANSGAGIRMANSADVQVSDTVTSGNYMGVEIPRDAVNIKFTGATIIGNQSRGVSLVTSSQTVGSSNIVFESTTFANNSMGSANNTDGIRIDRYDTSGYISNVSFKSCHFVDNQTAKTQRYGLTVGFNSGMSGIVLENTCSFQGNVSGDYLGGSALSVA